MRQCPNPACPFRLRHGFAAEFEADIPRCRSCSSELLAPPPSPHTDTATPGSPDGARATWRLGFALGLIACVAGLAKLELWGHPLGSTCLLPGLLALAAATVLLTLGDRVFAGTPTKPKPKPAAVLALALLALAASQAPDRLGVATTLAGLPLVLGLAAANERWGLGSGPSCIVAGLTLVALDTGIRTHADPSLASAVTLSASVLVAMWLARPIHGAPNGRAPLEPQAQATPIHGLGVRLTGPSSSLAPAALALALPWTCARLSLPVPPPWLVLVLALLLTLAFAHAYTRPTRIHELWTRAFPRASTTTLADEAQLVFRRALGQSLALSAALVLLHQAQLPAFSPVLLAAIALDLRLEWKLRRDHPILIATSGPTELVELEPHALALDLQGHPTGLRGPHHHALYRALGPWTPTQLVQAPAAAEQL